MPECVRDGAFQGIRLDVVLAAARGVYLVKAVDGGVVAIACYQPVPKGQAQQGGHVHAPRAAARTRAVLDLGMQVRRGKLIAPANPAYAKDLVEGLAHVSGIDVGQVRPARDGCVRVARQLSVQAGCHLVQREAGEGLEILDVHWDTSMEKYAPWQTPGRKV